MHAPEQPRDTWQRLVESAPVNVIVYERDGEGTVRCAACSEAMCGRAGLQLDQVLGHRLEEVIPTHAAEVSLAVSRVFDTGKPERIELAGTRPPAGSTGFVLVGQFYPVRDAGRTRIEHVVGIVSESAASRPGRDRVADAQARLRMLADTGELLSVTLDLQQVLDGLAHVPVPTLADAAWVWLTREYMDGRGDGRTPDPRAVSIFHRDPEAGRALGRELASSPLPDDVPYATPAVLRTGRPVLYADLRAPEVIAGWDPAHLEPFYRHGVHSFMVVPIAAGQRVVGTMGLARTVTRAPFDADDLQVATLMAGRAGYALENARLYRVLAQRISHMAEAQELARFGDWRLDLATNEVFWSDGIYRIHGLDPDDTPMTLDRAFELIEPSDRELVRRHFEESLRGAALETHYRIRRPDGSVRHCLGSNMLEHDRHGTLVAMRGFVLDVTEQRMAESRIREFLAMASHELRTPMTSIGGFAATLRDRWDTLANDDKLSFVDIIATQSERLARLVNDLLVLSKLEERRPHEAIAECRPAIDQAIAALGCASVSVTCAADVQARVDGDHLQQVLVNYLANALNHGKPPIAVEVAADGDWVTISVSDSGPGVPAGFVPKLFEPFSQAEESRADDRGSGLGLSIVKSIAEAHGGSAWYEPVEPHGARFCARFPQSNP